jgi:hypothetical protein
MHQDTYAGTLFANNDWSELLSTNGLEDSIVETVRSNPGLTREDVWTRIVQQHFMRYRKTDFGTMVNRLVERNILYSPTPRKQKRLNDACVLFTQ